MEQITEILIDNLRESFKAIEKFLHWWRSPASVDWE
jgi:hypothetical protein